LILVVIGVSGAGKSTLGRALAKALGWTFIEADDFHPPGNLEKLRRHQALNDADRAPWLVLLHRRLQQLDQRRENGVLACSALKRSYRELLSEGIDGLRFVYLCGEPALIRARLQARRDHFMPADLLDSQLASLEPPRDALLVSIDQTTEQQLQQVLRALELEASA